MQYEQYYINIQAHHHLHQYDTLNTLIFHLYSLVIDLLLYLILLKFHYLCMFLFLNLYQILQIIKKTGTPRGPWSEINTAAKRRSLRGTRC